MKTSLTSRERMLVAIRNQEPDVVPVAPDMSNMIPCRLTGKPFWDVYLHEDPPLWKGQIALQECHWHACAIAISPLVSAAHPSKAA